MLILFLPTKNLLSFPAWILKKLPSRFFPALDIVLLREVVAKQLPSTKTEWEAIHTNVNSALQKIKGCENSYVTQTASKDRLKTLQVAHKKDEMNSLRA
jgi:hypothetical protein